MVRGIDLAGILLPHEFLQSMSSRMDLELLIGISLSLVALVLLHRGKKLLSDRRAIEKSLKTRIENYKHSQYHYNMYLLYPHMLA